MPDPVSYEVRFSEQARQMLLSIADRRIQAQIVQRAEQLIVEPEKLGKPLTGDLIGYRSIRAVGQRYRILYRIEREVVIVTVVALGLRKDGSRQDVYTLAQKLLRQGLLDAPKDDTDEEITGM